MKPIPKLKPGAAEARRMKRLHDALEAEIARQNREERNAKRRAKRAEGKADA